MLISRARSLGSSKQAEDEWGSGSDDRAHDHDSIEWNVNVEARTGPVVGRCFAYVCVGCLVLISSCVVA